MANVNVPDTPPVQVTKGVGPGSLTQGDAKNQNDAAALANQLGVANQARDAAAAAPAVAPLPEPKYTKPTTGQVVTGTEADALYGPTQRPNEHITAGSGRAQLHLPPDFLQTILPALREAASVPGAPPALINMLQLIAYHLGKNNA